jgi:type IV pilus assembly protein PilQ
MSFLALSLLLGALCLAAGQDQHSAAPAVQAQAAKAAQVLARDAARGLAIPQETSESPQQPGRPVGGSAGQAPQEAKYSGELISLNLKDVDLKDFFRLIHEISGLNVIVDANVAGTLTLVLDEVPWDQALDIVLKDNGLSKVLEGNVLRIARLETLTSEHEAAAKLAEAQVEAAPVVTVFRRLHYAQAKTTTGAAGLGVAGGGGGGGQPLPGVVDIIKSIKGAGVLSKRGDVQPDPRNNTVIISDVPSQIPVIEAFIDKLDKRTPQVSIEAKVVLANSNFMRTLGVQLAGLLLNKSGSVITGGAVGPSSTVNITPPTGTATTSTTSSGANSTTSTGSSTGTGGTSLTTPISGTRPPGPAINIGNVVASGTGVYAISNASARYLINAAISAAETTDKLKVISAPTIVAQNNMLGEVVQGVQIPVQTVINNTVTTIYINAALQLDVIPQVTDDGNVFLSIKVSNNAPAAPPPGSMNPEITTQSATTQVLVPDGGTVVFGGVKISNRDRSVSKVPGLGSLPVLGNLFKTTTVSDVEQELIFFVTPKVLSG